MAPNPIHTEKKNSNLSQLQQLLSSCSRMMAASASSLASSIGVIPSLSQKNRYTLSNNNTTWKSNLPGFQKSCTRHSQKTRTLTPRAYKVELEHNGQVHVLEVEEGENVLEKALEANLDVSHDCKLGVCMTCPAKLISGSVDQSGGMLSDDVIEKGYALLCTSVPQSDCRIRTIPEEELLSLQLMTSQQ